MTLWDPDGPGPAEPLLIVAGTFEYAGTVPAKNIAAYNFATAEWSALGAGLAGDVFALATLPTGELVAGGGFVFSGSVVCNGIAKWNGQSWSPLGTGTSSPGVVRALAVARGLLYAGGSFDTMSGVEARSLASWNGTNWAPVGFSQSRGSTPLITAMAFTPDGTLFVGGTFSEFGNAIDASRVARFDGTNWRSAGTAISSGEVLTMTTDSAGVPIVGGNLTPARWTGTDWAPTNALLGSSSSIVAGPNGTLIAGGTVFVTGGGQFGGVSIFDGQAWTRLTASFDRAIRCVLRLPNGDLLVGGDFSRLGNDATLAGLARWNGRSWTSLAGGTPGLSGPIYTLTTTSSDVTLFGGLFSTAGPAGTGGIARTASNAIVSIGGGFASAASNSAPVARSIIELADGSLIAAGTFILVPGAPNGTIAKWNGNTWSTVAPPSTLSAESLLVGTSPGEFWVGGSFTALSGIPASRIARWTGTTFVQPGAGFNSSVYAMVRAGNGDVIAAGFFQFSGATSTSRVARWNGTDWIPMNAGLNGEVNALAIAPNGDIYAGGRFTGGISRWNGVNWVTVGGGTTGRVQSLLALPDGRIIAGGTFNQIGSTSASNIALWDGTAWQPMGQGIWGGPVLALTRTSLGEVLAGGAFTAAGGRPSPFLAKYVFGNTHPQVVSATGDQAGCRAGVARFDVLFSGSGPLALSWEARAPGSAGQWIPLTDREIPGLGAVDGSQTNALLIRRPLASGWSFRCKVLDSCEPVYSPAATLDIACLSPADIASLGGAMTCDGVLSADDLVSFLAAFFEGQLAQADICGLGGVGAPDGQLTVDDVVAFLAAFFRGCDP